MTKFRVVHFTGNNWWVVQIQKSFFGFRYWTNVTRASDSNMLWEPHRDAPLIGYESTMVREMNELAQPGVYVAWIAKQDGRHVENMRKWEVEKMRKRAVHSVETPENKQ